MNDRTAYSSWMLSFLAGGLAGASIALLLAPRSGKDTRTAMRRKLQVSADAARAMKDRVVRHAEKLRAMAAHRVSAAPATPAGNGSDGTASV